MLIRSATLLLLLLALTGCEGPQALGASWDMQDPEREHIERVRFELGDWMRAHIEEAATATALERELTRRAKVPWRTRIKKGIKYADLLLEIYKARGWRKVATDTKGPNTRGLAIIGALEAAGDHALATDLYPLAKIKSHTQDLQALGDPPTWAPVTLTPSEVESMVRWLKEQSPSASPEDARARMIAALVGPLGGDGKEKGKEKGKEDVASAPAPVPRLREQVRSYHAALLKRQKPQVQLELHLVDGGLRYARDLKHHNLSRQDWRDIKKAGGSKKLIYGRLQKTLDALAKTKTRAEADTALAALAPTHPQYTRLVALRRRMLEGKDVWGKRLGFVSVRKGAKGPRVDALRARLVAEGYLPKDADKGPVDEAMVQAWDQVRSSHQLAGKASHAQILEAFNRPFAERLATVDLALKRYRRSFHQGESDFVWVNLPDFHAEVYRDGKRAMRFRVVIGKANRVCDPKTSRWSYPNATPILHSELEYFILNPSWYVPERIIREELMPKMEKDEEWLKKNNYEIVKKRGDKLTIRQTPGPHNALGIAKFIFPNPHNTYMHDTARKKYFGYVTRARSHGCVRVSEPKALAEHLVTSDGLKDVDVDALLKRGRTKKITLTSPLPVFVEYHTVRVDEDGRAHWLGDVYHHDERERSPDPKTWGACTPKPVDPQGSGSEDLGP